ncbi:MAG: hypothetical protein BGO51_22060 [Rhodospirillales bacterium 69-11]|nr:single-stranded DNA-binding protein [Rhodospirillales bacterium]MBN8929964.1 single-stranded DNA-binding protein [Rhodospirillales bacterium]OJW20529.1 MAG: hypothetical protein BGO51_22060 [Rhodospirillales bacterium 69-11]
MQGINRIQLMGHVGKDPETRTTQNGSSVVTFPFATSDEWKNDAGEKQSRTQWHRIVVFNQGLGTIFNEHVKKGDPLILEGTMEYRDYEKDGVKRQVAEVVMRGDASFRFLPKPSNA